MFGRRLFLRGAGAAVAAAPVVAQNALQQTTQMGLGVGAPFPTTASADKAPDALKLLWDQQNGLYESHGRQRRYSQRTILAMRSWSPIFAEQQFARLEDEHRTIEKRMSDAVAAMRQRFGL